MSKIKLMVLILGNLAQNQMTKLSIFCKIQAYKYIFEKAYFISITIIKNDIYTNKQLPKLPESNKVILDEGNNNKDEIILEISDVVFHMLVTMAELGVTPEDIEAELEKRSQKIGNLKNFHTTDKNS